MHVGGRSNTKFVGSERNGGSEFSEGIGYNVTMCVAYNIGHEKHSLGLAILSEPPTRV